MSYSDTLATIALFVSVAGTIFSCLFSYHLSVRAEKRKEFNAVADRITLSLVHQQESAERGHYPTKTLSESDLNALLLVSNERDKGKIRNSFANYQLALERSIERKGGMNDFHSPQAIIKSAEDLKRWARHK
ncbi:hypothetical protein [Citrobacter portucalensis]|uniref:hypothetical protein n=1 Tax=Citrobacter portucalensis TaxID=1639133 RepID=UPI002243E3BA|nr:hypothetical protein [Citrobacter portucalensis]MCW8351660.1 hypothetical protein [Citrobacter portucalensis]MCX9043487.1 hypothetical protein [Citrobacter portucalensis]